MRKEYSSIIYDTVSNEIYEEIIISIFLIIKIFRFQNISLQYDDCTFSMKLISYFDESK